METKFVRIQSTMTILVTPGLQLSDYTDEKKAIPNKLNIKPRWQNGSVQVKQGVHYYPAEITKWNTVKALEKKGIFTIGEVTDSIPAEFQDETKKVEVEFEKGQKELNIDQPKKTKKLAEI